MTIDEILQECDDACEGANYHDRVGLVGAVWDAVKKYIPRKDAKEAAKAIAEACMPIRDLSNVWTKY